MIIITTILFFINIIFKYFLKLFFWHALLTKSIIFIVMTIALYFLRYYPLKQRLKLSYLRRKKQEFTNIYKFKNNFDQRKSIIIFIIYIFIFVFCILMLRLYGINRTVDLKLYYEALCFIIKNSSYFDLVFNIILVIMAVVIYRQILQHLFQWFKCHRIKIHLYCVQFAHSYVYIMDGFSRFYVQNYYEKVVSNIRYLLYSLGLKRLHVKSDNLYWDITRKENAFPFESFFLGYLLSHNHRIHYHILLIVFCLDLFYNNWMIVHTYTILPMVFLYDIWVRMTKTHELQNITYDIAIYHIIYVTIIHQDDYSITFGTDDYQKSYDISYIKSIIIRYIRNNFKDRDIEYALKILTKQSHILDDLIISKYFIYFCIFILCHYIIC